MWPVVLGFIFKRSSLFRLQYRPNTSAKRSSSKQSAMRESAIQVYESRKDAPEGKLWCPIAQDYFNTSQMKAAHIVPSRLGPGLVEYLFGSGSSSRLHTWDNCLILCSSVEENFDKGNFVLIPADPNESPIKTWKIQLTNVAAKYSDMGHKTLAQLDGKQVLLRMTAGRQRDFYIIISSSHYFAIKEIANRGMRNTLWN
ncbi:hypothetical protein GJ744_001095 [Endocarpon pusillum]|uniref:HNH nuclease domain-containing protein n=1 Tax=Endocarpon pusillum TaxID=364733 RepID=A0A8H7ACL2_9EURO|nr:hypothetical protein GJ744_001095 [Endocarpon pusillum]